MAAQLDETSVNNPIEAILLDLTGVSLEEAGAKVGNGDGNGMLHISSTRVLWSSPSENIVREWNYRRILLHAICREAEKPHIYCQVATGEPPQPDDDEVDVVELKLIPTSSDSLQSMWDAMSTGAAMNPDPDQPDHEDEGDFFFNSSEVNNGDATDTCETEDNAHGDDMSE